MPLDEKTLKARLEGKLFLIPPQELTCEYCGHLQPVPIAVMVTEVSDGFIHGKGGSMVYTCDGCGAPTEVDWDSAHVMITQFEKGGKSR